MSFLILLVSAFLGACATTQGPQGASSTGSQKPEDSFSSLPPAVLMQRGTAYLAAGNYPMAELHFARALKSVPDSEEALLGLGESFLRQEKYDSAQPLFEKVLSINDSSVPALLGLGKVYRARGDDDAAVAPLARAADLAPDDPAVLTELAVAYEAVGKESSAEPLFARVTELRPRSAAALNNLGFNCLLRKRYAEAVVPLEKALALAPGDRLVLDNLALAYAMTGQDAKAFQLFERTVGRAGALNNMGYLYMVQGDWEKAETALNGALEADPKFYERAKQNLDELGQILYQRAKKDVEAMKEGASAAAPAEEQKLDLKRLAR